MNRFGLFFMIYYVLALGKVAAQSPNRQAVQTPVQSAVSLPVDTRLQASIDALAQSLKTTQGSPQDQLDKILLTDPEFDEIFFQTYQAHPQQKDKVIFQQKKSDVVSLLNSLRNPNIQTQVLNVVERSGDNSLRSLVVTLKLSHQNLNKQVRFVMLKFNQVYKILMVDE